MVRESPSLSLKSSHRFPGLRTIPDNNEMGLVSPGKYDRCGFDEIPMPFFRTQAPERPDDGRSDLFADGLADIPFPLIPVIILFHDAIMQDRYDRGGLPSFNKASLMDPFTTMTRSKKRAAHLLILVMASCLRLFTIHPCIVATIGVRVISRQDIRGDRT